MGECSAKSSSAVSALFSQSPTRLQPLPPGGALAFMGATWHREMGNPIAARRGFGVHVGYLGTGSEITVGVTKNTWFMVGQGHLLRVHHTDLQVGKPIITRRGKPACIWRLRMLRSLGRFTWTMTIAVGKACTSAEWAELTISSAGVTRSMSLSQAFPTSHPTRFQETVEI